MPQTFISGQTLSAGNMEQVPKGRMAHASVTATTATITTVVDISGLSITFTGIAAHYYEIKAECMLLSSVANDAADLLITDGSNNIQQRRIQTLAVATVNCSVHASVILTGLAGSVTYKVRCQRSTGSGNVTFNGGAGLPAYIAAIDLGF